MSATVLTAGTDSSSSAHLLAGQAAREEKSSRGGEGERLVRGGKEQGLRSELFLPISP